MPERAPPGMKMLAAQRQMLRVRRRNGRFSEQIADTDSYDLRQSLKQDGDSIRRLLARLEHRTMAPEPAPLRQPRSGRRPASLCTSLPFLPS